MRILNDKTEKKNWIKALYEYWVFSLSFSTGTLSMIKAWISHPSIQKNGIVRFLKISDEVLEESYCG